ncbi:MAG: tRNA (adenosine(37)-N6)-threonylcarbamoyltransferase complex dimerization subunit type 1 TsaB [Thiolinea sp.]
MKLLALDTSSDACSVAVRMDDDCHLQHVCEPRAHARLILPMIEQALQHSGLTLAGLDAIAFGRGPGSFTGLRIAAGIVQGLALAADKPVLPISTLAAIAQQAHAEQAADQVLVASDARMGEVYWGAFVVQDGIMQLQGEEQVLDPALAPLPKAESGMWTAAGTGWAAYAEQLLPRFQTRLSNVHAELEPQADYLSLLAARAWQQGLAVSAEQAQPVYLRNKVAQTLRERGVR